MSVLFLSVFIRYVLIKSCFLNPKFFVSIALSILIRHLSLLYVDLIFPWAAFIHVYFLPFLTKKKEKKGVSRELPIMLS